MGTSYNILSRSSLFPACQDRNPRVLGGSSWLTKLESYQIGLSDSSEKIAATPQRPSPRPKEHQNGREAPRDEWLAMRHLDVLGRCCALTRESLIGRSDGVRVNLRPRRSTKHALQSLLVHDFDQSMVGSGLGMGGRKKKMMRRNRREGGKERRGRE
jgi:hypothetical protein